MGTPTPMTRFSILLLLALLLLSVAVSAAETSRESEPTRKSDPAGGRSAIPLAGKVTELLTSGGYTYVNLSRDGISTWVAFPTTPVKVGQELLLVPGYEMKNFTSKSLNRTFERVIFSAGPSEKQAIDPNLVKEAHKARDLQPQPPAEKVAQPATQQLSSPAASIVPPHSPPPSRSIQTKVKKAVGANAYTVKQLYDRRSSLDNKRVLVRGRVVKINPRILKQCWIHLQDGTGTPGMVDSVLVTTTPSTNSKIPSLGDVVTATGILHKDRDYGGSYRYAVILDNTEYRGEDHGKKK